MLHIIKNERLFCFKKYMVGLSLRFAIITFCLQIYFQVDWWCWKCLHNNMFYLLVLKHKYVCLFVAIFKNIACTTNLCLYKTCSNLKTTKSSLQTPLHTCVYRWIIKHCCEKIIFNDYFLLCCKHVNYFILPYGKRNISTLLRHFIFLNYYVTWVNFRLSD